MTSPSLAAKRNVAASSAEVEDGAAAVAAAAAAASLAALIEANDMGGEAATLGLPSLEAPVELSTVHAQLTVLEESIRAAIASAAGAKTAHPPPVDAKPAEKKRPSATPVAAATGVAAAGASPAGAVAEVSERMGLLHDSLRRVRRLMEEYEEASQRVVELHMHQGATTEAVPGSLQRTGSTHGGGRGGEGGANVKSAPPSQPSPTLENASCKPQQEGLRHSGTPKDGASPQRGGPSSLYRRRALASDAVLARFCGLSVGVEKLLLPVETSTPADVDTEMTNDSRNSVRGGPQGAAATVSASPPLATERQSAGKNIKATLEAYAKLFFQPAAATFPATPRVGSAAAARAVVTAANAASATPTARPLPRGGPPRPTVTPPSQALGAAPENRQTAVAATEASTAADRELRALQLEFAELQRCRLFPYEAELKEAAAAAASDVKGAQDDHEVKWQHLPVLVQRMQETLTALQGRFTQESHVTKCGPAGLALVRQLRRWTQPLLLQLNVLLSNPTLEEVEVDTREKLRRMTFDIEELQQAQADAIASGDMQHSEELYYEQTSLSEAMAVPYDELEATMNEYEAACVEAPLQSVMGQCDALTARLTQAIEAYTAQLAEVTLDMERVKEKRRAVAQARHRQRNNISTYHHTWRKAWQSNGDQQTACYRAMEQLEQHLRNLQEAQRFLTEDWISRVSQERQREEDAAAFACFADARAAALAETQRNHQAIVEGLRQYSGAIQFSCRHAEAFAHDVLQRHLQDSRLALRKDRLEQFRTLYLTLGDLRFKKTRHAEEIQKKIAYYTLQQEVAMDALNPKAKEFSQAKQRWEQARLEAQAQLDELDQRSERQLEGFRPTERLLREAGVEFLSPEEELAQRTHQRTLRLIEYQQLIEEGIGVRPSPAPASVPVPSPLPTVVPEKTGAGSASQSNRSGSANHSSLHPMRAVEPMQTQPRNSPPFGSSGVGSTQHSSPFRGSLNRTFPISQMPVVDKTNGIPNISKGSTSSATPQPTLSAGKRTSASALHATEEQISGEYYRSTMMGRIQTSSRNIISGGGGDAPPVLPTPQKR